MPPAVYIAVALLANSAAGLAGGLLPERRLSRLLPPLVGFAAGALIAAVFLDVLPETLSSLGAGALSWILGSFVFMALLEWWLGRRHHHEQRPSRQAPALPAAVLGADAVHNLGDGAVIAAAFLVSPRVGWATTFAVVVHEVPQELGDYALLRAAGWKRGRALLVLAGIQLTAFIGALGVVIGASAFDRLLGVVLAVACGSFLYIGATDLLPEVQAAQGPRDRRERLLGFLGGVLALLVAAWI